MMRKRLLIIVLAALLCLPFGLFACSKPALESNGLQKVEITNKTELQAEWNVGDEDRTITLAFTPNDYSVKNLSVVSSSDAIIVNSENSLKLRAAKKGSATITVTADGKTDSVTITVKDHAAPVDPELENVEITNKTELQAEWNVGDEDRTITLAFTPNDFTPNDISVTSDSAAVTVDATDKLKLRAAEQGTANITVTADGKTDSVTITVTDNSEPPLEELSGITLNESDLTAPRFIVGESRNIVVTYGTDGYNSTNTPATASVTGDAVTVDGLTLTAAKAGTATITVKVGNGEKEKTAQVTVTVLPELNDITVTGATVGNDDSNTVDYNDTLDITVAPSDTDNYNFAQANIEVISDSSDNVTVIHGTNEGEYKITAKTVGQFTVSITARNNICKTLKINCVPTAPTLDLSTTAYEALTKENIVLDFTASACDSTDNLDVSIAVKDASGNDVQVVFDAANKKFALAEKGNYSVTVTAKDHRDNTKQQTATATVEVYRNVFKAVSGKKIYNYPQEGKIDIVYSANSKYVSDDAQKICTEESDVVMAQFDTEASVNYYAEATYTLANNSGLGDVFVGMTHSLPNGDNLPVRWLAAMVDRGDRNFKIKDIDMTRPATENPFDHSTDRLYRNGLTRYIVDTNALEVKISIARIDDFFYTFINDQFVMMNSDLDYSAPTVPGIYGIKLDSANAGVTVSKMSWITDRVDVQNKVNELYTSKLFAYNNTPDAHPTFSSDNSASEINFTTTSDFSDSSDGVLKMGVTPYAVFDGDFKVEYDYKIDNGLYDAIRYDRGAIFKVLPANHMFEWKNITLAAMGVRIIGDNSSSGNNVFYHSSFISETLPGGSLSFEQLQDADEHFAKFDGGSNECTVTNPYSTYPVHAGDTVHFAFERRLKADCAEYTYKITVGGKTITRVQEYSGDYWSDPAVFVWFNQSTHGTASNITWQTIA